MNIIGLKINYDISTYIDNLWHRPSIIVRDSGVTEQCIGKFFRNPVPYRMFLHIFYFLFKSFYMKYVPLLTLKISTKKNETESKSF